MDYNSRLKLLLDATDALDQFVVDNVDKKHETLNAVEFSSLFAEYSKQLSFFMTEFKLGFNETKEILAKNQSIKLDRSQVQYFIKMLTKASTIKTLKEEN